MQCTLTFVYNRVFEPGSHYLLLLPQIIKGCKVAMTKLLISTCILSQFMNLAVELMRYK